MKCTPLVIDGKAAGFMCGARPRRRKCGACGTPGSAIYQCDWKLTGPKAGKTCDCWLCPACATKVGGAAEDKHLCPGHLRMWDRHPRNPKNQNQGKNAT